MRTKSVTQMCLDFVLPSSPTKVARTGHDAGQVFTSTLIMIPRGVTWYKAPGYSMRKGLAMTHLPLEFSKESLPLRSVRIKTLSSGGPAPAPHPHGPPAGQRFVPEHGRVCSRTPRSASTRGPSARLAQESGRVPGKEQGGKQIKGYCPCLSPIILNSRYKCQELFQQLHCP